MDSSESSGSNEGEQLDEPEEQVDDMSIFIEALLQKLEQVAEWPSKVEDLKQFIQTALPKIQPVTGQIIAMFLMSEGLLEKISDKEFKFNVKEIQNYEFSEVAEGWEAFVKETMPEASKEEAKLPAITELSLKKVIAYLRLNSSELPSDPLKLRELLPKISQIGFEVDENIVFEEMEARNLFRYSKEKNIIRWYNEEEKQKPSWFKSILGMLVVVLFWGGMIMQLLPAGGGMKRRTRQEA